MWSVEGINCFPCSGELTDVLCARKRQGRAAICCWKNPGSSFSPGTAKSCRWFIRASSSHHTVLATEQYSTGKTGICTHPELGRSKVRPEDLLFSGVNQEKDNGFTDLSNRLYQQQSREGRRYGKPTVPPGGTWVEKSTASSNVSHR